MNPSKDKIKIEFTHKGWHLFCPIWIADWQRAGGSPIVYPRYRLRWLFWLADQVFFFMSAVHKMRTGEILPFCYKIDPEPLENPVILYCNSIENQTTH
ncbi:MAG: hypothetical protein Q4D82_02435 [Neisseria sp.]|nr:hypothetical protein [Neisseria sp.]